MVAPIRTQASSERLGCLEEIDVFFTDVCTGPRLCNASTVTSIQFNRILDDTSKCQVTAVITDPACCECFASLEPWCHMMHIVRNGELVWQGPLTRITYQFEQVVFEAEDIIAFLKVTIPLIIFENSTSTNGAGEEITDIAVRMLEAGFADRKQCLIENIIQADIYFTQEAANGVSLGSRPSLFKDILVGPNSGFKILEGTYFDWWQSLAENGLDYTVIGTTIVLAPEEMNIRPLRTLTENNILGEIELVKDGFSMSNRAYVRFTGDDTELNCVINCNAAQPGGQAIGGPPCEDRICNVLVNPLDPNSGITAPCYTLPCPALAESTDKFCYGAVERIFTDQTYDNLQSAQRVADQYVKDGSRAARYIDFPSGAKLGPDTPWGMNDMIPGQKVLVAITELCLDELQEMRLLEVTYSLSVDGEEEVTISLGPYNKIGQI